MSKGTYNQFFNRLGLLESGDNYFLTGSNNELGRYQLDEAALIKTLREGWIEGAAVAGMVGEI